jgi:hydrogenase maturation protease
VFGDDGVGWRVVDWLRTHAKGEQLADISLETASSPADLLGLLEGQRRLILVDACRGLGTVGGVVRLRWPNSQIVCARHGCGHNITLDQALNVAMSLGKLPEACELWCIEGASFEFGQPLSRDVEAAAQRVAAAILHSLRE